MPTRSQFHSHNTRTAADPPFAKEALPLLGPLDPLDRTHVPLALGHVHPATSAGHIRREAVRVTDLDPGLEVQEPEIHQVVIVGIVHKEITILIMLCRRLLADPENPLILNLQVILSNGEKLGGTQGTFLQRLLLNLVNENIKERESAKAPRIIESVQSANSTENKLNS